MYEQRQGLNKCICGEKKSPFSEVRLRYLKERCLVKNIDVFFHVV